MFRERRRGGHLTEVDWVPTNFPSGEVGHNIRGKKFAGLRVVLSIGIDHQVDAGMWILSDQVDGLGDRTDEAATVRGSQPPSPE